MRSQFMPRDRRRPDDSRGGRPARADFVNGVQQSPIEGTSMVYSFDEADAPERHDLQYFEMAGNRGIYFKGWSAVTRHSTPWLPTEELPALDDDVWELYDGNDRLVAGARPGRGAAGPAGGAAAAVADRGGQVQRAADRRPPVRAAERDHRRPSAADHRHHPGAVPRDEAAQRGQRHRHQEPVVQRDRVDRAPARRADERGAHRAGRPVRRLGAVPQGRAGQVRLQRARHAGVRHRGDRGAPRGQPPGPRPSSPTTAAVSRRAATSPCTTTGAASAPGGST